jgi:general secretion pathway protein H
MRTVDRATPPTSPLKISNRIPSKRLSSGFTLIEVMVVLMIIAGVMVAVVGRLGGRNNESKAVLRGLINASKELHIRAKLKGATYRLVIDMKDGDRGEERQSFWIERSDKAVLMSKDEEEKNREEQGKLERDKEKPVESKGFTIDTDMIKKPHVLPKGMYFEQVELTRTERPITTGKAYIHYLPQGLVDEAAIHLRGEHNVKWTISIHPLTGKAELSSSDLSLKQIRDQ